MGTAVQVNILPCWKPFIEQHPREGVFYGGSGSGKTFYMLDDCWLKGLAETEGRSLVLMEDMTSVKSDCFEPMIARLNQFGIGFTFKESAPYEITLQSGHRITFSSTSRSSGERSKERLKKFTDARRVYVNEVTAIREDDYDMLTNRMGRSFKDAQIISSFNPVDANHWAVKRWVYPYLNGTLPKGTMVIHTTYKDNPTLSEDWVLSEIAKGERNPNYQRVYLEGQPGSLEGLVYTEGLHWELTEEETWPSELDHMTPHAIGVDWGSKRTAAVAVWMHDNKRYAKELLYESGLRQDIIEAHLNGIFEINGWSKTATSIRCDSAEPDRIYSLARSGFMRQGEDWTKNEGIAHVCIPAYKAVRLGIEQVMESKIYVHPSSMNLKDELRNYIWDPRKDERELDREPMKGFDHAVDALRYAIAYKPMEDRSTGPQKVILKPRPMPKRNW